MSKRPKSAQPVRKKRKGNTTIHISTFDSIPTEESVVEHVRAWDISTSERTGRITGRRRILKHQSQAPPSLLNEPSTSKEPGESGGGPDIEDAGILADTESKVVDKPRRRRKRAKIAKENDSVSDFWPFPFSNSLAFPDKDGNVAYTALPNFSRRVAPS